MEVAITAKNNLDYTLMTVHSINSLIFIEVLWEVAL